MKKETKKANQAGGLIFAGGVILAIIVTFLLLITLVIPAIKERQKNQKIEDDIFAVKKAIESHISQNETIPNTWEDLGLVILDYIRDEQIDKNLSSGLNLTKAQESIKESLASGQDYVGVFSKARCLSQEVGQDLGQLIGQNPGLKDSVAIVYSLKDNRLVCQQVET